MRHSGLSRLMAKQFKKSEEEDSVPTGSILLSFPKFTSKGKYRKRSL